VLQLSVDKLRDFRWVVFSLVGAKSAISGVARDAREEANHIARIGRQEPPSGFPNDAESLPSAIDNPDDDGHADGDIEHWASGLGVLRSCDGCGGNFVDPKEFAGAAVTQLKVRGKKAARLREELEKRVRSSAVDSGGWNYSGLCSYCDYVMSMDT
jgi:hypothetical protein